MKIHTNLDSFKGVNVPVLTSGTFDGVHTGHRKLLQRLKQIASENEGESVVLTFSPHPRTILFPDDHALKLLSTLDEKIELLAQQGIDHLIIYPFTKAFSRISSLTFIRDILVNQIGAKHLVIGYNHHFGRNREGTFQHLQSYSQLYGFNVQEIPAEIIDSVAISSTKIRHALQAGDIKTANNLLGYAYYFTGTVIHGKAIGRTIGFPTANLKIEGENKLIPLEGVYIVNAVYNSQLYQGMMNIGKRPTLGGTETSIEVNLFQFNQEIYNESLKIAVLDKIRDEVKFSNLEQLRAQINHDKMVALNYFK